MDFCELADRFTYHKPNEVQTQKYESIRGRGYNLANAIVELCPEGNDRDTALRKVQEAVMWANASIARHKVY